MTDLFLVRHGETIWNTESRYQGWKDSPLTATGKKQAIVHGRLLAENKVSAIFASPLGRVRQTVELISHSVNVEVFFDERLREINIGDWGGQTIAHTRKHFSAEWAARKKNPITFKPPNGESRRDLQARVAPAVDEILAANYGKVAIVSHGITTRVILNHLLGLSIKDQLAFTVPNECIYQCLMDEGEVSVAHFMNGVGPVGGLFST